MKVLITAQRGCEDHLLRELKFHELGKFEKTDFRDVLTGEVDDFEQFLSKIEEIPFLPIGKIIPIDVEFEFSSEQFPEVFIAHAKNYVDRISPDETFCVKVTRRGMKGIISSHEIAMKIGAFIQDSVEAKHGKRPKVNLENPDKILVIETLGNKCLMELISRSQIEKSYLIRP